MPFLGELIGSQKENDWEICFSRSFQSWNDVTIIPSFLFLVPRFCTPPEVKFHVFGTSKHGAKKSHRIIFFAIFISTLWRFYRANKKKLSYTLQAYSRKVLVVLTAARAAFSFFTSYPIVADFCWWTHQADVAIVRSTVGNISRRTQTARAQSMLDRVKKKKKNYSISIIVWLVVGVARGCSWNKH